MYSARGTKPHRSLSICSTLLKKHTSEEKHLSISTGVFTFLLNSCDDPFPTDAPQSGLHQADTGGVTLEDGVVVYKQTFPALQDFLLLNADIMFDVDFNRFVDFHKTKGGIVTLFTHPNSHPHDSGLIIADSNFSVSKWLSKEDVRPQYYKNRVNAGLHVISPKVFDVREVDVDAIGTEIGGKIMKVDLDRQILKPLCGTGKMFCYDSPEYVKDMGTPDRYMAVCEDYNAGRIHSKNLKKKQKAVFLDRDGTINKYVGFLKDVDEFELLPNSAEAIKKINDSGYLAIVVTNQPVIARA